MNFIDSRFIPGNTWVQKNRWLAVLGWSLFVVGAIWVFVMTLFAYTATVGIPFAMKNNFQGHLDYLDLSHWVRGLKSPETIGIFVGICLLVIQCRGKWDRWCIKGLVLFSPFLFASFLNFDRPIFLRIPWWILFFLTIGPFLAPYMTLHMFFQEVDGEFWIDGGNVILMAGWWSLLCFFSWLGRFMHREGLILPKVDVEQSQSTNFHEH